MFGHSFGELEIDYTQVQERVTGNCNGRVMVGINQGGGVNCQDDDVGLQACRTCMRAAGSGQWGSWQCTPYAYAGGGLQTSPIITGGDSGTGWWFQIRIQCI